MKNKILLFVLLGLAFCSSQESADLTLKKTQFGMVQGAIDETFDALYWQGIPYAKAPVGDLRWKKPVDPDSWTQTLVTTNGDSFALQMIGGKVTGTEDSLNLDVYRPNSNTKKLPVLVYIHGGNNQGGKSVEITGESFVKELNVVYVSINYRLGVLGFNPLPALKTGDPEEDSGNYTLLDIAKSLDWVKNNIAEFGGDPGNITISGFSAGGRDVMAILTSPIFKGKFHKAISFSGGMSIADKEKSSIIFASAIAPLVVEDKVKSNLPDATEWLMGSDPSVKEYLYQLSSDRLIPLMGNAGIRMSVFPHLFNDGYVLPQDGFKTQNYNSVPLMMVSGTTEFSMFASWDKYFAGRNTAESEKEYTFSSIYGSMLYNLFNVVDSATTMTSSYKNDIYGLEIRFGENKEVVGEKMARFGSFHGVFAPLWVTNSKNYLWLGSDEGFQGKGVSDLGVLFRSYLRNFLVSGNPNDKTLPSWDKWSANSVELNKSVLILDADKDTASASMGNPRYTYKEVLDLIDADTTISPTSKRKVLSEVLNGRWFSRELDIKYKNTNNWVMLEAGM